MSISNSAESVNFYEDDTFSGNTFRFSEMSGAFQLPVEQNMLLAQIRSSNIPTEREEFQAFVSKLVSFPVCDEAIERVWELIFKERCGTTPSLTGIKKEPLWSPPCQENEDFLQTETSPGREHVTHASSHLPVLKCVPIEKLLHSVSQDNSKIKQPNNKPSEIPTESKENECNSEQNNLLDSMAMTGPTYSNFRNVRVKQEPLENDCVIEYEKLTTSSKITQKCQTCEKSLDSGTTLVHEEPICETQLETSKKSKGKKKKCKDNTKTDIEVHSELESAKSKLVKTYLKKKQKKSKTRTIKAEIKQLKEMLEVIFNKINPTSVEHDKGNIVLNSSHVKESKHNVSSNSVDTTVTYIPENSNQMNGDGSFVTMPKSRKKYKCKVEDDVSPAAGAISQGDIPSKQCVKESLNKPLPIRKSYRLSDMKNTQNTNNSSDVIETTMTGNKRKRKLHKDPVDVISKKASQKLERGAKTFSSGNLSEVKDLSKTGRTKFSWQDTIIEVLKCKSPAELSMKKLKKKVIAKYIKHRGKMSENTEGKFMRYLEKIPGISIDKDYVTLSYTDIDKVKDDDTSEAQKRKKSLIVKSVTTTTKYHLVR